MRTDVEVRGETKRRWTLSSRKADGDMETRVSKEDTLSIGDSTKVIVWFPEHPPALSKFMPPMPTLLALSARSRERDKDVAPPTRIAPLPALPFQPGSGGQKVQECTGEQWCLSPSPLPSLPHCNPSHEVTALGSIFMHLALISPVRPSRQLSGSLQSSARVSTAQLPMATTAKRSHGGHMEDIPDTALGRPGGAFNIGHSSHLLGQHSTLFVSDRDKSLLG